MAKYVSFQKVEAPYTTLEFRGNGEGVEVHHFDGDVVSISGEDALIDALILAQAKEIGCKEITLEAFKAIASQSAQISAINQNIKNMISMKYDVADEISMMKRDASDAKRIAYEVYVAECKAIGDAQKADMGYL